MMAMMMRNLLELLHDLLVERKADDEEDAHDEEEDGADDVHHQVDGEVPHLLKRSCLDDCPH